MNELCPLYNTEICLVLDFCLMAIKTLSFLTSITLTRTRQSTLREKKSSIHNIIKSCPSFVTHCHINSFEVNMMSCLISCPTFRCSLSPVEQTHHGRSVWSKNQQTQTRSFEATLHTGGTIGWTNCLEDHQGRSSHPEGWGHHDWTRGSGDRYAIKIFPLLQNKQWTGDWQFYGQYFSVRRHPRAVLRPDEAVRGWGTSGHHKVSVLRRLRGQGILQYRGDHYKHLTVCSMCDR